MVTADVLMTAVVFAPIIACTGADSQASFDRRLVNSVDWGDAGYCGRGFSQIGVRQASTDVQKAWEEAHNHYRACHGVAPLRWNENLAQYAKAWAEQLASRCHGVMDISAWVGAGHSEGRPHDPESYQQYPPNGENIFSGQGGWSTPAATAVEGWYREVDTQCRHRGSTPGCDGNLNHFTAMMWKNATEFGCYMVERQTAQGLFVVSDCRYSAGRQASEEPCAKPNTYGCDQEQVPALVGLTCPIAPTFVSKGSMTNSSDTVSNAPEFTAPVFPETRGTPGVTVVTIDGTAIFNRMSEHLSRFLQNLGLRSSRGTFPVAQIVAIGVAVMFTYSTIRCIGSAWSSASNPATPWCASGHWLSHKSASTDQLSMRSADSMAYSGSLRSQASQDSMHYGGPLRRQGSADSMAYGSSLPGSLLSSLSSASSMRMTGSNNSSSLGMNINRTINTLHRSGSILYDPTYGQVSSTIESGPW